MRMNKLAKVLHRNLQINRYNAAILIHAFRAKHKWTLAVADAEKLVGYKGSFFSLQSLLTDEAVQLALSARKLISRQKHPLFQMAGVLNDRDNMIQTWGLTVLLISRAANKSLEIKIEDYPVDGIFSLQHSLAEIVELICTANLIHSKIIDHPEPQESTDSNHETKDDFSIGNKLGVLGGDYLLAGASVALSKLKNTSVVNDMAQGIADMTIGQLMPTSSSLEELQRKIYLSQGSILANSCMAALKLANHSQEMVDAAYKFGKNLSMAYELNKLSSQKQANDLSNKMINYENGISLNDMKKSVGELSQIASNQLNIFAESDDRTSLQHLALALRSA